MIVVDSSVWIAQLRGEDSPAVRILQSLDRPSQILVGDLILMEVLQGARSQAHAERLEGDLGRFAFARMVDRPIAIAAAANSRALRERGITIRKSIDLLIATFCIENGHWLLHQDRDFEPLARHCGLRVL